MDGNALFIQQMEYSVAHSENNSGDIVFVASLGDVWQHHTEIVGPRHLEPVIGVEANQILARNAKRTDKVVSVELPKAKEGCRIISDAGIPFGVAPGNHDYLNPAGERQPNPLIGLARIDQDNHNSAEQLWSKLISQHGQIFMLVCGHQRGQSFRVDDNNLGKPVYQILVNYQDRGQVTLEAGYKNLPG